MSPATSALFEAADVQETELSDPPSPLSTGASQVMVLVKLHDHALGTVLVDAEAAVDPTAWRALVWKELGSAIAAHLGDDRLAPVDDTERIATADEGTSCAARRDGALHDGEAVTVVIATRGRPQSLARCFDALLADRYPRTEIVVVDNAPPDEMTAELVRSHYRNHVRYVREEQPGLAVAHNCGLQLVDTPLVAFTDDDVTVDPWWVTSLVAAFIDHPGAGAVTGLITPDELETRAQVLLERHGSFGKGTRRRVFDLDEGRRRDPLFPFTAGQLGSGANMAFRTATLRRIGGFDPALGSGTRAKGGDDLAALFAVVADGHQVVYEPAALVRHRHHRELGALASQSFGYGVGLGAFLTGAVVSNPGLTLRTARHFTHGARYAFSSSSERNRDRYDGWPSGLAWRERVGLVVGPAAYLRSRLALRRAV